MTMPVAYAIALAAAVVAGWLVPALVVRSLVPSLSSSKLVTTNYRGRSVFLGLGLVWVAWAVALLAASTIFDAIALLSAGSLGSAEMLLFDGPLTLPVYAVPFMLVAAAVLFGMVDDVFGGSAEKGFRGHLGALTQGRLTTGGLKLLGIGVVSAVYGWHAASSKANATGVTSAGVMIGWWVAATALIALSANFVNLTDLRPGRALKTYAILATGAGAVFVFEAVGRFREFAETSGIAWSAGDTAVTLGCLLIVLLGPVLAVWRFDLGERGMLGDAGSNAMGAIVGYLLAGSLSLPWLAVAAVVALGLNVLSELVSFSTIIERTPPLAFLDRLGRRADGTEGEQGGGA